jgi:Mitochondrial carrier protein
VIEIFFYFDLLFFYFFTFFPLFLFIIDSTRYIIYIHIIIITYFIGSFASFFPICFYFYLFFSHYKLSWMFSLNSYFQNFRIFQAVTIAQIPYWILRNPSEVIKTRLRTKMQFTTEKSEKNGNYLDNKNRNKNMQINRTNNREYSLINNIRDLYSGIGTNLMYALPSDWLKFLSYEFISKYLYGITIGQGNFF